MQWQIGRLQHTITDRSENTDASIAKIERTGFAPYAMWGFFGCGISQLSPIVHDTFKDDLAVAARNPHPRRIGPHHTHLRGEFFDAPAVTVPGAIIRHIALDITISGHTLAAHAIDGERDAREIEAKLPMLGSIEEIGRITGHKHGTSSAAAGRIKPIKRIDRGAAIVAGNVGVARSYRAQRQARLQRSRSKHNGVFVHGGHLHALHFFQHAPSRHTRSRAISATQHQNATPNAPGFDSARERNRPLGVEGVAGREKMSLHRCVSRRSSRERLFKQTEAWTTCHARTAKP